MPARRRFACSSPTARLGRVTAANGMTTSATFMNAGDAPFRVLSGKRGPTDEPAAEYTLPLVRTKPAKGLRRLISPDIPAEPSAGSQYLLPRFARPGPLWGRTQRVQDSCSGLQSGPTPCASNYC